jgi:DNA-binding MarR family transcriptional regulator
MANSAVARARPPSRDRSEYTRSVLDSLRRTVRAFRGAAHAAQAALGITGAQHFVLQKLADAPALSLNELAARTMTHKSSVSVAVSRLVERGFVRRQRSPADARSIVVTLTPSGRRALGRAPDSAQARLLWALRRFPPRQLAEFSSLFERFTKELGASALEPRMLFEDDALAHGGRRHSALVRGRRRAHFSAGGRR